MAMVLVKVSLGTRLQRVLVPESGWSLQHIILH